MHANSTVAVLLISNLSSSPTALFLISISGWIAVNLIGLEVVLPYVYRRGWLSRWLRVQQFFQQPYLARMWPYCWLGYLLLALGVVHSALPTRPGGLRGQNMTGIWLGTLGWRRSYCKPRWVFFCRTPRSASAAPCVVGTTG